MAAATHHIKLSRFERQPWGFRLHGGADFATPLLIQLVRERGGMGVKALLDTELSDVIFLTEIKIKLLYLRGI